MAIAGSERLWIIVMCILIANGDAISPVTSPAPTTNCESIMAKMTGCAGYIAANGTESRPEVSCCKEFEVLLKFDSQCYCYGVRKSIYRQYNLNYTRLFTLVETCHVQVKSFDCRLPFPIPTKYAKTSPSKQVQATTLSPPPPPSPETTLPAAPAPVPAPTSVSGSYSLNESRVIGVLSLVLALFCGVFA